jgi:hypothetical protein
LDSLHADNGKQTVADNAEWGCPSDPPPRSGGRLVTKAHIMRLILIIVTLLGSALFGYALITDIHLENGWADAQQVLYPKGEVILPSQASHNLTPLLENIMRQHRRDSFIVCASGGCIFMLGFVGLIIERRRNV